MSAVLTITVRWANPIRVAANASKLSGSDPVRAPTATALAAAPELMWQLKWIQPIGETTNERS